MSAFCIHLDDDTPLFKPDYQHPHYTEREHVNVDVSVINPYWFEQLAQHDLEFYRLELFYGPPGLDYVMGIHTDRTFGDWGKINWIYGGEGYQMHWYKPIASSSLSHAETKVHSRYDLYEPDQVQKLYSTVPQSPSIVQVGVPHNITNPGQERWCYSMVIHDKTTQNHVSFGRLRRAFGK